MHEIPVREGKAPFRIPSIDEPCFTYYKIIGDLSSGTPPVIVAHGGPGVGHEYLLTFADLWQQYGLPVVFYDQIGCASSSHLPQKAGDRSFWQEQLFQDELDNLLDHLELRRDPGFHLLGQSWGGMLGSAFAARQPRGLRRLVLASALASAELGGRGTRLLRDQMPPDMRQALDEAEQKGEYDSPAYKRALDFYYRKHVCRADPFPPAELVPALKHLGEDTTVYRTMYGPSPLTRDGSLTKWSVIPRLPEITAPTLVYNGEYDTSHDITQVPFFELIPRVRWITFPGGGHMCHLEGGGLRERVLKVVGEFLTQKGIADVQ
ncbi:proline-specific peptidase [Durotheca rogersii]|uniref:proline-specific peptidase n=1 Tax=Durotheca rogersii TaxID=419775 RepID=UPI00221FF935|nr:proline-specific peptidase [Durotheca rogersii]KAI5863697.1 proline-specific peptidase [Durotheca rogersii]